MKRLISVVGKGTRLENLMPLDFAKIKLELYKPAERKALQRGGQLRVIKQRSVVTVDGDVRRILVFLNWCKGNKLVKSIEIGDFKPSTRTEVRKQRKGINAGRSRRSEWRQRTFKPSSTLWGTLRGVRTF